MSWEVLTVKQKTSFFNWGLSRSILKRSWPVWLAYFVLMLAVTAANLPYFNMSGITDVFAYSVDYNYSVISLGIGASQLNMVAGVVAAMTVYSFMYSSRTCGMINALPIRRETAYITAYITGLAPIVIADVLSVLAVWLIAGQTGLLYTSSLWTLAGFVLLSGVAFYSFASFCAVLTGNVFVLPAVYVVLGCVAFVVIGAVGELLSDVIYGMASNFLYNGNAEFAYYLSPLVYVLDSKINIRRVTVYDEKGDSLYTGEFSVQGLDVLAVYCAVGLALCVCAVLIYRRREMERAGDVVAVPALMPVFKYCMTFGTALLFSLLVYHNVLTNVPEGFATAVIIAALMLVGAAIGYYAAEMLMQKTLKVFNSKFTGLIVSCVILVLLTFAAELDVMGYETYVPAPEEIEKAELSAYGNETVVAEAENIAALINLHKDIIADKKLNEFAESRRYFDLTYTLKDGSIVSRSYRLSNDTEVLLDEDSNVYKLEALFSTQEAKAYYLGFEGKNYEVSARNVDSASVDGYYVVYPDGGEDRAEYRNVSFDLTKEQAAELYECILLDAKDSSLGSRWFVCDEEYYNTVSNLDFYINIKDRIWQQDMYGTRYSYYPYLSLPLTLDATRTMNWLKENTDLEPIPLAEADPEEAEEQLKPFRLTKEPATHTTAASIGIIGGADGPTAIFVSG